MELHKWTKLLDFYDSDEEEISENIHPNKSALELLSVIF